MIFKKLFSDDDTYDVANGTEEIGAKLLEECKVRQNLGS